MSRRQNPKSEAGFTLTELLVLVAVGAILTGLFLPQLSQTRSQLLRDACAAKMKHWGLVFDMYSQDYRGGLFETADWSDTYYIDPNSGATLTNPYVRYFGGSDPDATMRSMRLCPFVVASVTLSNNSAGTAPHSYSTITIPLVMGRGGYENMMTVDGYYWPNLKACPNPAQYLMMIDGTDRTLECGSTALENAVNGIPNGDTIPAIDRHSGGVNCLFGDEHVEYVLYQRLVQQDAVGCGARTGNPWFNMN